MTSRLSAEFVRRPHWCGKCNSEWFDSHTCPHVFNSATGGNLGGPGWSEPPMIIVKKYEWDWLWSEVRRLTALLAAQTDGEA